MGAIIEIIRSIRNVRAQYKVASARWIEAQINTDARFYPSLTPYADTIKSLARANPVTFRQDSPAGSTEDGIERQKLMCTAIIEKGDRITADDLVATWIKVCDPEKMVNMTEQFDRDLLAVAKSGIVQAGDLGNLCKYSHLIPPFAHFTHSA